MLMNRAEKAAVNNPARAALQRHYELPLLTRLGGPVTGLDVLEVGCGSGNGTRLLLHEARVASIQAFDLDPGMVTRARRRLASDLGDDRIDVSQGDVAALPTECPAEHAQADATAVADALSASYLGPPSQP